jgi:biopolymer transport protein ExbD
MAKVKVPRKSVHMDMTAMCDVGFLLLTFFILTTSFKPDEPITVDTPTSTSKFPLTDSDLILIQVDNSGKVFFGVDKQPDRIAILGKISEKYGITFTEKEKHEFSLVSTIGMPISGLKAFLDKEPFERKNIKQPGIPADSSRNELFDWLAFARIVSQERMGNQTSRIAIKGDRVSNYEVMKNVIGTLQAQKINRFNLITGLEAGTK